MWLMNLCRLSNASTITSLGCFWGAPQNFLRCSSCLQNLFHIIRNACTGS